MLLPAVAIFTRVLIINSCYHFVASLQCYTDIEGRQIATCNELEGFKTCFTKYNDSKFHPSAFPFGIVQQYQEATVIGRGCSTKNKVFYRECETHSYGDSVEKMCFCSFMLCNSAPPARAAPPTAKCSGLVALCLLISLVASRRTIELRCDLLCSKPAVARKRKKKTTEDDDCSLSQTS